MVDSRDITLRLIHASDEHPNDSQQELRDRYLLAEAADEIIALRESLAKTGDKTPELTRRLY